MSTIVYKGITEGDYVICSQCGKKMLLPYGADKCPECYGCGTLDWIDNEKQEASIDDFNESSLEHSDRELTLEDCLGTETLALEYPDYYRELKEKNNMNW